VVSAKVPRGTNGGKGAIDIRMLKKLMEYAVIAALVAVVVIGITSPLGANVGKLFATVAGMIERRPFFCHDEARPDASCAGIAQRLHP